MKRLVAMTAVVLLPVVVLASPWDANGGEEDGRVERLSARQLAGQRVVAGFNGNDVPSSLRRLIRRGQVAGVILFADNYADASGARAIARELQSVPRRSPLRRPPLLVMIDQEGGLVKRLPGPPCCSAETMGGWRSERIRREGRATGRYLQRGGVNVDLAPVLDVARPGGFIGAQDRAFGGSARQVKRAANAFALGLERGGVAATAKHFPGLGAARTSTDDAVQRIGLSRSTLRRVDERPYARFRRVGGSLVMLSLAAYPSLGSNRPAALASPIAKRELRRRVGFEGVSITDALDTPAARAVGRVPKLAKLGAGAGTDLLLFTTVSDATKATRTLVRKLRSGAIPRANFKRSATRVLDLRLHLGG